MNTFSQKGISLYITIMIMAVVLSVVIGLTTILLGQMRTIRTIGYSVVAIYAADTGVEEALNDIFGGVFKSSYIPTSLDNSATYQVEVVCCQPNQGDCVFVQAGEGEKCPAGLSEDNTCLGTKFCIKSLGTFKGVRRAIEVKI